MTWTQEDKDKLLAFKKDMDSDDIRVKEKIKQILLNNRYIIHVLANKELEENVDDDGTGIDEYFGVNILPYYMIHPTQTHTSAFICYEVSYDELERYNNTQKKLNIIFYVLCDQKMITDADTGIAKHDLLAALIQDQFDWTNYFGKKIHLISDVPSVVDTSYACRTLIFEQITDNNLVRTNSNGTPRLANKDIIY